MAARRSPPVIELTGEVRAALVRLTRSPAVAAAVARRARIVRLAADGRTVRQIAATVGVDPNVARDPARYLFPSGLPAP